MASWILDRLGPSQGLPWWLSGEESACLQRSPQAGDSGLFPESGRSSGERTGNPLQCSCLGNAMDRGAWWAPVHWVTKSWTRLSNDNKKAESCWVHGAPGSVSSRAVTEPAFEHATLRGQEEAERQTRGSVLTVSLNMPRPLWDKQHPYLTREEGTVKYVRASTWQSGDPKSVTIPENTSFDSSLLWSFVFLCCLFWFLHFHF